MDKLLGALAMAFLLGMIIFGGNEFLVRLFLVPN